MFPGDILPQVGCELHFNIWCCVPSPQSTMVHSRPMRMALPLTFRVGDGRIEQVPRKMMDASSGLTGVPERPPG